MRTVRGFFAILDFRPACESDFHIPHRGSELNLIVGDDRPLGRLALVEALVVRKRGSDERSASTKMIVSCFIFFCFMLVARVFPEDCALAGTATSVEPAARTTATNSRRSVKVSSYGFLVLSL